jgi:hypothetical protein
MFFSEEKNQKTFMLAPADGYRPWPVCIRQRRAKVFWFFSSEKNILACLAFPEVFKKGAPI